MGATMRTSRREASLDDLLVQMKIMNRLLAAPLKQSMGQQALVRLLLSTGATAADIADVLDTTSATVMTTAQRLKNKAKGTRDAEGGDGK